MSVYLPSLSGRMHLMKITTSERFRTIISLLKLHNSQRSFPRGDKENNQQHNYNKTRNI